MTFLVDRSHHWDFAFYLQSLKRRSSILDSEIGSFGPIRRIRQKQSLLSSRGLGSPVSGNISISGGGLGPEAAQKASLTQKLDSLKNGDSSMPSTSLLSVPSKSSEMASKILQQLDRLVSPKDKSSQPKLLTLMDKSPTKLSPSMLHGRALKSLETLDSSKFLGDGDVQDDSKLDGSLDKIIPHAQDIVSPDQDMVRENGPLKIVAPCEKSTIVNVADSMVPKEYTLHSIETMVSATPMSVSYPPQKKRAFQMSAHEVFCSQNLWSAINNVYIYVYVCVLCIRLYVIGMIPQHVAFILSLLLDQICGIYFQLLPNNSSIDG